MKLPWSPSDYIEMVPIPDDEGLTGVVLSHEDGLTEINNFYPSPEPAPEPISTTDGGSNAMDVDAGEALLQSPGNAEGDKISVNGAGAADNTSSEITSNVLTTDTDNPQLNANVMPPTLDNADDLQMPQHCRTPSATGSPELPAADQTSQGQTTDALAISPQLAPSSGNRSQLLSEMREEENEAGSSMRPLAPIKRLSLTRSETPLHSSPPDLSTTNAGPSSEALSQPPTPSTYQEHVDFTRKRGRTESTDVEPPPKKRLVDHSSSSSPEPQAPPAMNNVDASKLQAQSEESTQDAGAKVEVSESTTSPQEEEDVAPANNVPSQSAQWRRPVGGRELGSLYGENAVHRLSISPRQTRKQRAGEPNAGAAVKRRHSSKP